MPADPTAFETFRLAVPEADLADLRERLARTRWPDAGPDETWASGVPLDVLRPLAAHWQDGFDWRAEEARLNAFPQLTTTLDGERVHLVHARSPEPGALPLLLTHGWPGSVLEMLDVLGPLTDPRAYGGDPADAFHVVAPSIPGYPFSGPLRGSGWDPARVARAWVTLMGRLGYDRYGTQGGDWGSYVSREVGVAAPENVVGVHLNMLYQRPTADEVAALGPLAPDEEERFEQVRRFQRDGAGYSHLQSTRPQTLAYALTDSPVGQLAWVVEKFHEWTDLTSGGLLADPVDRDRVLADVSAYWFTRTAGSSAQLYRAAARAGRTLRPLAVPTGVAVFPHDIVRPVRRLAERSDHLVHWTEMPRGGHFAAMEEPGLLVDDVRAFFRGLRPT